MQLPGRTYLPTLPTFANKGGANQRIRWFEDSNGSPSFNHCWMIWGPATPRAADPGLCQHSNLAKDTAEKVVKDIRRATRKQYSAEEKIRIVLEGLRGEDSIAVSCAAAYRAEPVLSLVKGLPEGWKIIRLVEQTQLPVRRTLGQIGIPRSTFYRWYDQYQTGGPEALDDRSPRPDRVCRLACAWCALSSDDAGKIERWHQTLKNRILLENYYLPGDLEAQIDAFVAYYNHRRYHESIDNLTPADVYFGRGQTILLERERIKRKTIQNRRLLHHKQAA